MKTFPMDQFLIHIDPDKVSMFPTQFLSMADFHFQTTSMFPHFKKQLKEFQLFLGQYKNKVEGVLIPGDLLLIGTHFTKRQYFEQLVSFLNYLSTLCDYVIISKGNHDMLSDLGKSFFDYLREINPKIVVLDNEQVVINGNRFTGFSPSRSEYNIGTFPEPNISKSFDQFQQCNFNLDDKANNIVLCHDHRLLAYPHVAQKMAPYYPNISFIVGGHLHDGYAPLWLRDKVGEYGTWENFHVIDKCRGMYKMSENGVEEVIVPDQNLKTEMWLNSNEAAAIVLPAINKYSGVIPSTFHAGVISLDNEMSRTRKL